MGMPQRKSYSGFNVRNEREKFLVMAAAGTALAVAIIMVLVTSLKSKTQVPQVAQSSAVSSLPADATISLLAPEFDVPENTKLSNVRFKKIEWPKAQLPDDIFTAPEEVASLYSRVKLGAGLPVQRKNTSTIPLEKPSESLKVPPGFRAVTIQLDERGIIEGHALPGTHVDVVLTYSKAGNIVSEIIVEDAIVLSNGGDTTSGRELLESRAPMKINHTATVAVSVTSALKIQTSQQLGRLALIMRSANDTAPVEDPDFAQGELDNHRPVVQGNSGCQDGSVRIGKKSYLICNGSLVPVK